MSKDVMEIIAFVLGVVGLPLTIWYSWYLARRGDKRKRLVLDVGPSVPLASVFPEDTGLKLSIVYEKEGVEPKKIQGAYLTFIRIGNLGREPIRSEDTVPADPLYLTVRGTRVLDVATVASTRPVIAFHLGTVTSNEVEKTQVTIHFRFLDYRDGALIRVLTEGKAPEIKLNGTIIGMPIGIERQNYFDKAESKGLLSTAFLLIASLFAIPVLGQIFNWFHMDAKGVGKAALSIGFGFAALTILYAEISGRLDSRRKIMGEWPIELSVPFWFRK